MNLILTLNNLDKALSQLVENDSYLLKANLSERSIAHRLALYLTKLFSDFDVDCEYNGDIDSAGLRKILDIPREVMEELAVRSINDNDTYNIFPDIILHQRGSNARNLLVVEIKKSNSYQKMREYDLVKLKAFTNQYQYRLGVFLELGTGKSVGQYEILYFQKGEQRELEQLLDF